MVVRASYLKKDIRPGWMLLIVDKTKVFVDERPLSASLGHIDLQLSSLAIKQKMRVMTI